MMLNCISFFFFFSSRRRHTRCLSDWSSDVCSSDLTALAGPISEAVIGPAKAVDVIAVVGLKLHRLADVVHRRLEVLALIDPGVAEVVEHWRLVGRKLQRLLQVRLRLRPILQTLVAHAARIVKRPILLGRLADEVDRATIVVASLGVALM